MKILVLAESLEYARILMNEFHRENSHQISHRSGYNILHFKDGTMMRFESIHAPAEAFYGIYYDQLFTTEGVCHYHRGDMLRFVTNKTLFRSSVPGEYLITILEE